MTAGTQTPTGSPAGVALRPVRASGFRMALLLGATIMTLALGATAAYLTWEGYRQSLRAAQQQATAMAEGAMGVLDKRLQVAAVTLASLADDPRLPEAAARRDAWAAIRNSAKAVEDRDAFGPAWMVLRDGSHHALGAWDEPVPRSDGTIWERQAELRRLTQPGEATPGGVSLGNWQTPAQPPTLGDHWFVPLAVATADAQGRITGAVTMAVRLRDIRLAWQRLSPPVGATLWLRDGRQPGRSLMARTDAEGVQPWVAYERDATGHGAQPQPGLISSGILVREWPLTVEVTLEREGALADWARYTRWATLAWAFGTAIIWVAAYMVLGALGRLQTKERERRDAVRGLAVMAAVVESAPEGVVVTDAAGVVVRANPAAARLFGAVIERAQGQRLDHLPIAADAGFYPAGWPLQPAAHTLSGETLGLGADGETIALLRDLNAVHDEAGVLTHWVFTLRDLREIRHAQAATQQLTWNDPLTGLANRHLLMRELGQAVRGHGALVLLNLAGFQSVNDAHGFGFGDEVLKRCGDTLSAHQPPHCELARLGADEFALLWRHATPVSAQQAQALVSDWLQRCGTTLTVGDETISLRWRCGVALLHAAHASEAASAAELASEWLRRADLALQQVRRSATDVVVFSHEIGIAAARRFAMERGLASANLRHELRLYLQPQVSEHGDLQGFEALVRWQHPEQGLLPPAQFIGLAESSGLIHHVDAWVLREACLFAARRERSGTPVCVSVNISAASFRRDDFLEGVRTVLADTGVSPSRLVLEITETLVLEEFDAVVQKMHALVALGVELSLDDFGTGYSSLSYLKRLPIQEIKIDRSFIMDIDTNTHSAALVYTIIALAHHLRLRVVAEGVETLAQARALAAAGPVLLQGYLLGAPAPASEVGDRTHFSMLDPT